MSSSAALASPDRTSLPPVPNRPVILIASLVALFCTGAVYSFSVLRDPLVAEKGFTVAEVVLAYSINIAMSPVPMILGGRLVDRGYARWVALAGGTMLGLGWLISGTATSVWQLVVGYGLIAAMGQGFAYGACLANNVRLYPERPGLASGLSVAANGAASVVIAPLAHALIDLNGAGWAMTVLGVAFAAIIGASTLFIRAAPAQPAAPPASTQGDPTGSARSVAPAGLLRLPSFWLLATVFICGASPGLIIAANASPIGVTMYGLTTAAAALSVSGYAAGKATGAFAFGAISDRVGPGRALALVFAIVAVLAGVLIATRGQGAVFMLAVAGIGLCFGGVMAIMPALVHERFGPAHHGTNYGIVFGGYAMAGLVAPQVAAALGAAGDYAPAFLLVIGSALLGLVLLAVLARVRLESDPTRAG